MIIGHPRRYLVEFECRIAKDDSVAGVVAALETDGPCGMVGQLVYGLALSFVAPLGSKHDAGRHRSLGHYGGRMNALAENKSVFRAISRWEAIMKGW